MEVETRLAAGAEQLGFWIYLRIRVPPSTMLTVPIPQGIVVRITIIM